MWEPKSTHHPWDPHPDSGSSPDFWAPLPILVPTPPLGYSSVPEFPPSLNLPSSLRPLPIPLCPSSLSSPTPTAEQKAWIHSCSLPRYRVMGLKQFCILWNTYFIWGQKLDQKKGSSV